MPDRDLHTSTNENVEIAIETSQHPQVKEYTETGEELFVNVKSKEDVFWENVQRIPLSERQSIANKNEILVQESFPLADSTFTVLANGIQQAQGELTIMVDLVNHLLASHGVDPNDADKPAIQAGWVTENRILPNSSLTPTEMFVNYQRKKNELLKISRNCHERTARLRETLLAETLNEIELLKLRRSWCIVPISSFRYQVDVSYRNCGASSQRYTTSTVDLVRSPSGVLTVSPSISSDFSFLSFSMMDSIFVSKFEHSLSANEQLTYLRLKCFENELYETIIGCAKNLNESLEINSKSIKLEITKDISLTISKDVESSQITYGVNPMILFYLKSFYFHISLMLRYSHQREKVDILSFALMSLRERFYMSRIQSIPRIPIKFSSFIFKNSIVLNLMNSRLLFRFQKGIPYFIEMKLRSFSEDITDVELFVEGRTHAAMLEYLRSEVLLFLSLIKENRNVTVDCDNILINGHIVFTLSRNFILKHVTDKLEQGAVLDIRSLCSNVKLVTFIRNLIRSLCL